MVLAFTSLIAPLRRFKPLNSILIGSTTIWVIKAILIDIFDRSEWRGGTVRKWRNVKLNVPEPLRNTSKSDTKIKLYCNCP